MTSTPKLNPYPVKRERKTERGARVQLATTAGNTKMAKPIGPTPPSVA